MPLARRRAAAAGTPRSGRSAHAARARAPCGRDADARVLDQLPSLGRLPHRLDPALGTRSASPPSRRARRRADHDAAGLPVGREAATARRAAGDTPGDRQPSGCGRRRRHRVRGAPVPRPRRACPEDQLACDRRPRPAARQRSAARAELRRRHLPRRARSRRDERGEHARPRRARGRLADRGLSPPARPRRAPPLRRRPRVDHPRLGPAPAVSDRGRLARERGRANVPLARHEPHPAPNPPAPVADRRADAAARLARHARAPQSPPPRLPGLDRRGRSAPVPRRRRGAAGPIAWRTWLLERDAVRTQLAGAGIALASWGPDEPIAAPVEALAAAR